MPSALRGQGYEHPDGKILFHLIPADLPKGGMPFDLALAVSLLQASGQLKPFQGNWLFLGELGLHGQILSPSRGTLLAAMEAGAHFEGIVSTHQAAQEAALAPHVTAYGIEQLNDLTSFLSSPDSRTPVGPLNALTQSEEQTLLEDVKGQENARQALVIAACGRHPLLLQGPPGTGKSLLARRLPQLLPALTHQEALEVARIEACVGQIHSMPHRPPFRAPHTSVSGQGILGGGRPLRPGEISRAHRGILFLDELPEFTRPVLEGLRQPLEEGEVRIQRAHGWAQFPAAALLIAARNPCPCGYHTHPEIGCRCTAQQRLRYASRTSGPLLDRMDLFVEMGPVHSTTLTGPVTSPTQKEADEQLATARNIQAKRLAQGLPGPATQFTQKELIACGIASDALGRLQQAGDSFLWSGRGLLRCLRVARSIADLDASTRIEAHHVMRAVSFRSPEVGTSKAEERFHLSRPLVARPPAQTRRRVPASPGHPTQEGPGPRTQPSSIPSPPKP